MTEEKKTTDGALHEDSAEETKEAAACDSNENTESSDEAVKAEGAAEQSEEGAKETDKASGEEAEKSAESGENAADRKESGSHERRSFRKKKEKKDPRDEKLAEMTDRLQRQMAEFDNFRKRTEKEKAQMFDIGAKSVIEKILPVVDNFERGLENCDKDDPFAEGMTKIYKQLQQVLTDLKVTPIEAVGKEFDPEFHNAVMHTEDEEAGENVVVEEFQKGYLYKDSVVRHSMVKVAN